MWHEFSFHVYSKQAFANWNNQTAYVMVNTDLSARCISTCMFLFVARARAKTSNKGSIPVRLKVREVKWLIPYVPFLNFSDEEVKQKGLDNIILGWGLTGALTSLLMVSPFAWILPEMIQKFLFPQGVTSLLYLIVVSVCDILLDIGCVLAVSKICKCDFGKILGYHPFSKMLRHAYISSLTVVWAPCALGNFGWVFQHLCVAAFETACWFGAWHDKESASYLLQVFLLSRLGCKSTTAKIPCWWVDVSCAACHTSRRKEWLHHAACFLVVAVFFASLSDFDRIAASLDPCREDELALFQSKQQVKGGHGLVLLALVLTFDIVLTLNYSQPPSRSAPFRPYFIWQMIDMFFACSLHTDCIIIYI